MKTLYFLFVMSQINSETVNKYEYQESKYSRSSPLLLPRTLPYMMAVYFWKRYFKIKLDVLIHQNTKVILSINHNQRYNIVCPGEWWQYVEYNAGFMLSLLQTLTRSTVFFHHPLGRYNYWKMWQEECILASRSVLSIPWTLLVISLFSMCIWEASHSAFEHNHRFLKLCLFYKPKQLFLLGDSG